ncbi:YhcH/YjgK/YiaL family protein [Vibrio sp. HN007]|uniref:YhcH/YjgK/YiaL family protein n=1 Tax=Vibrio iocasae TaxID=3098914 RepID=UPI0035D40AFB
MLMLVGKINKTIEHKYYPSVVTNILEYLNQQELDKLPTGRHELPFLDSNKAWFVILEYQTEQEANFKPEIHHHHSDLQIVLSGTEKMAWCLDEGEFENDGEYLEQRDLQYYKRDGMQIHYLTAQPDRFYLFTPNTVHFTNIKDNEVSEVRKLVVKIHNDLLVA